MASTRRRKRPSPSTLPSCAELDRLLDRRNDCPELRKKIDREIFRQFRCTRAVFVLDMAGFSVSVQRHGIIHHLAKIHRMRALVGAAVVECRGVVVKFEADNAYATFPSVRCAVLAAERINSDLRLANSNASEDNTIQVSIGIGYGPILLACDDFYGDEVNLASKVGEDIAQHDEVLLTERAVAALRGGTFCLETTDIAISGIHLKAARLKSDNG